MSEDVTEESGLTRRDAIRAGAGAAGGFALAGGLLGRAIDAMGAPAVIGEGPYGPLGAPDANGLRLPAGFSSRVIARSGQGIGPRPYTFHILPDGMGAYKAKDGGFILTSNSEAPFIEGYMDGAYEIGTAAIRFDKNFNVTDAYPILKNTMINCAGGVTPWGTWLSCEEIETGKVFECDPWGEKPQVAHPAMGVFKHEACCVDPAGKQVYLTEDLGDGCFYRFTPDSYPDLSSGRLDVASVNDEDGKVTWIEVPDPQFTGPTPTRRQVEAATRFRRGEGMWFDEGTVYFATTQDDRVYAYHPATTYIEVLYDGVALGDDAPLHDTDNVTVSPISGDLYVCEDPGGSTDEGLQVCIISAEGEAAPFCEVSLEVHSRSELTGPVFDPTGSRLYFTSQRAQFLGESAGGIVYEISGPFRKLREDPEPLDRNKPALKVRTLGRPSLKGLLKKGQPFMLEVRDESMPVAVEATLIAPIKRARGRGVRQVTIARRKARITKSGKKRIQMIVGKGHRRRLRDLRRLNQARLVVVAIDAKGNRRKVVKPVSFR